MDSQHLMLLSSYAPFVQLMAGAYLLFFYSTMLQRNRPLQSSQARMTDNLLEIAVSWNAYLDEKEFEKDVDGFNVSWSRYCEAVGGVARFSFFYSIVLLIYAGIEAVDNLISYKALLVDASIYVFYTVVTLFGLRSERLQSWKAWFVGMFLMVIVGFLFPPERVNEEVTFWGMRINTVVHLLCFISAFAVVAALIRYVVDELHFSHIEKCISKTRIMLTELSDIDMSFDKFEKRQRVTMFVDKYAPLLGMSKSDCRISKKEGNIDICRISVSRYFNDRHAYWMSPVHSKLHHHFVGMPHKLSMLFDVYPCEFTMMLLVIAFTFCVIILL